MNLSKEDKQELYYCICCRIGIIETGEPMLRASDAIKQGKYKMIKPLFKIHTNLYIKFVKLQNIKL